MKKKSFLIVAVLCLALLFTATVVACTGDGNTDETPGNTDVTPGGDDVTPGGDDVTPGGDDVTPGGDDVEVTPESEFTFTDLGNNQWSLTKYNGSRVHIKIPSTHNGGDVVEIGDEAFCAEGNLNSMIKSVVIPDSVTMIGLYTFYGCNSLSSVVIPDSVTTIGEHAFEQCFGLISVTIGELVSSIGESAFDECYKLIEVYNKSDLNITAGSEDNGYVGYYAKNVYTEEGGSKLSYNYDGYIFYYDRTNGYLVDYKGDKTDLILPDSFIAYDGETINSYEIYMAAFIGEFELVSVVISDSVTAINEKAFEYCYGLSLVTIGNSVTDIMDYAFYYCFKLIEVYNKSELKITAGSDNNGYVGCYAKNVYTEEGRSKLCYTDDGYIFYYNGADAYLMGYCGDERALILPDSFTAYDGSEKNKYEIYQYAFGSSYSLTSVDIPNSVTTIGEAAFMGCTVTSVVISDSVTDIGESAFSYCFGLTSVTIGESVMTIGSGAFAGCVGLTSLVIPDSVTTIGSDAFRNCDNLTSVTIGDSVKAIEDYAFYGCTGLTSATISDSVTTIGHSVFRNCNNLSSVTFEDANGWQVSDSESFDAYTALSATDLSDPATATEYLTATYTWYNWRKV